MLINVECEGLVRNILQRVDQYLSRDTHLTGILGFHLQMHLHYRFKVGSHDSQLVFFDFK